MGDYRQHFSTLETPQAEPARADQVQNAAGGYAWAVDDWQRLDRFLILGTEGGTYYVGERTLTRDSCEAVQRCIVEDGLRVVARVVEVSESGRAPKNDPALFVLAMCAGASDEGVRRMALYSLPRVARIGTHLFQFNHFVEGFRGRGRMLRRALASWYDDKGPEKLAYQMVKYQQRHGWSHKDLLDLRFGPKSSYEGAPTPEHAALYAWACQGEGRAVPDLDRLAPLVAAFEEAKSADAKTTIRLIREHGLTREMVATEHLSRADVWEALLETMPLTAMVRNLANMSKVGLLKPLSPAAATIRERLTDGERVRKARVHPIAMLLALRTYASGRGFRGTGEWEVVPQIVDALNEAFYLAFDNVVPTGKRMMLSLDVSGSMDWGAISGTNITPRVGAAAMALVTARTEPNWSVMAFATEFIPVNIAPRERLDDVIAKTDSLYMGGTDCALPMIYALKHGLEVDAFVVYTDSETWAGEVHPFQALRRYRDKTGIPAKLVVVGMVSNGFTIADPSDPGMLDVVGFDAATPNVISGFVGGPQL